VTDLDTQNTSSQSSRSSFDDFGEESVLGYERKHSAQAKKNSQLGLEIASSFNAEILENRASSAEDFDFDQVNFRKAEQRVSSQSCAPQSACRLPLPLSLTKYPASRSIYRGDSLLVSTGWQSSFWSKLKRILVLLGL